VVRSATAAGTLFHRRRSGMMSVQAVDVGNHQVVPAQDAGQNQQTQRFGPEVVGGEIMNPGVDQQYVGSGGLQIYWNIRAFPFAFGCRSAQGTATRAWAASIVEVVFVEFVREILHRGFFQLAHAEKQGILFHPGGDGHLPGGFDAGGLIAGMNHGIEIVGPISGRIAVVAVRHLFEGGHGFSRRIDAILSHLPGDHGVGGISGFLMPDGGPKAPNDAPVAKRLEGFQQSFLGDLQAAGDGRIGPFEHVDIALDRCDHVFFQIT